MKVQSGSFNQQVEDALARFGSRLLCPEVGAESGSEPGEALYDAYIAGRITRTALRRAFLARLEDPDQAQRVLTTLQTSR